ncbi:MAG: hypothetical protein GH150_04695 [Hadesarchaea archaeon]|nr:hypothetical protein [Hadesarchaea archaeon]
MSHMVNKIPVGVLLPKPINPSDEWDINETKQRFTRLLADHPWFVLVEEGR